MTWTPPVPIYIYLPRKSLRTFQNNINSFFYLYSSNICLSHRFTLKVTRILRCNDSSRGTYGLEQRAYLSLHDCYNKQHLDGSLCCFLDPSHLKIISGIEGVTTISRADSSGHDLNDAQYSLATRTEAMSKMLCICGVQIVLWDFISRVAWGFGNAWGWWLASGRVFVEVGRSWIVNKISLTCKEIYELHDWAFRFSWRSKNPS